MPSPVASRASSRREGATVQTAEDEVGQRTRRGRLVHDRRVLPRDVRPEPGRRGGETVAVEREGGRVPRRELRGVEVPALVVAALERATDEPQVVAPRGRDLVVVTDRQHIGGPVGEAYAGAGRGGLHDRLGVVGDGVLEALLGCRDAAERGVVVGAVVQAGAAARGGVDHPRHQRGAVRAEDRLRRLDLQLEPQGAGRQAEVGLESLRRVDQGLDLLDRGDLGQGDHEAVRQRPALGEPAQEQGEGPQPAVAGRRLEALEPDAATGG